MIDNSCRCCSTAKCRSCREYEDEYINITHEKAKSRHIKRYRYTEKFRNKQYKEDNINITQKNKAYKASLEDLTLNGKEESVSLESKNELYKSINHLEDLTLNGKEESVSLESKNELYKSINHLEDLTLNGKEENEIYLEIEDKEKDECIKISSNEFKVIIKESKPENQTQTKDLKPENHILTDNEDNNLISMDEKNNYSETTMENSFESTELPTENQVERTDDLEDSNEIDSTIKLNENIRSRLKYNKGGGRVSGDIYGFYNSNRSHTHPSNYSKMVERWYNFINVEHKQLRCNSLFNICKKNGCSKNSSDRKFNIEKRIQEGVPLFLKYRVWKKLILKENNSMGEYKILKEKYCGYEYQIDVDIQRTLREHSLYYEEYGDGQCDLFNVLVAFANHEPRIGYCQGMSNFTGIILMYFNEEETFEMLKRIIYKNNLTSLFDHNLSKLSLILKIQKKLLYVFTPEIALHLEHSKIPLSAFMCSWYLTLFSRFDIEYVLRFYDLFFYYGFSILPLLTCAILKYHKNKILTLTNEQLMEFLNNLEIKQLNLTNIIKDIKLFLSLIDIKEIDNMIQSKVIEENER